MWYVYLVRCCDNSLYCGITNNLDERLRKHNAGTASKYTRSRLPVAYVYREEMPDKSRVLKREYAIKQMTKAQKEDMVESA